MPAAWPVTVPQRFAADAEFGGPEDTSILTPFDKGPPASRRNTLASPERVSLTLAAITREEFAAFDAWFKTTLSGGSETFEMHDPTNGTIRVWRFAESRPPYSRQYAGGDRWHVSFSLWLYPAV